MSDTRPAPAVASARQRFIVKKVLVHGTKAKFEYRVYDMQRGSFPYRTPELGEVAQDHASEMEAESECKRLTEEFGYINPKAMSRKSTKRAAEDDADGDDG